MKKLCASLMILAALYAIPAMAATTTLTGVVTDDMCGSKHMMPGKSDAECVRACVKSGAKYAIVTGGKVYILAGNPSEIGVLAGRKVAVKGDLKDNVLTVTSIALVR